MVSKQTEKETQMFKNDAVYFITDFTDLYSQ